MALGYLSRMKAPIFVREIAQATGISAPYLAKIVHALARKGFLVTQRGTSGGVLLAREPETISLYEICEAFDDPIALKRCMLGGAPCSDERNCPAHRFWQHQRDQISEFLRSTTLKDVARFQDGALIKARKRSDR